MNSNEGKIKISVRQTPLIVRDGRRPPCEQKINVSAISRSSQVPISSHLLYLNAVPEDRDEGKDHYRAFGDDIVIVLDVFGKLSRHAL
jgi:hypothetical protein